MGLPWVPAEGPTTVHEVFFSGWSWNRGQETTRKGPVRGKSRCGGGVRSRGRGALATRKDPGGFGREPAMPWSSQPRAGGQREQKGPYPKNSRQFAETRAAVAWGFPMSVGFAIAPTPPSQTCGNAHRAGVGFVAANGLVADPTRQTVPDF
jgi:hypothetical protein